MTRALGRPTTNVEALIADPANNVTPNQAQTDLLNAELATYWRIADAGRSRSRRHRDPRRRPAPPTAVASERRHPRRRAAPSATVRIGDNEARLTPA